MSAGVGDAEKMIEPPSKAAREEEKGIPLGCGIGERQLSVREVLFRRIPLHGNPLLLHPAPCFGRGAVPVSECMARNHSQSVTSVKAPVNAPEGSSFCRLTEPAVRRSATSRYQQSLTRGQGIVKGHDKLGEQKLMSWVHENRLEMLMLSAFP